MAATQPTLKVEIAFASTPLATSPTWTDVSAYVRINPSVKIKRGRPDEMSWFNAGSCILTLANRDRRFDPSYASGPYFGNLIPRKQIRVTATWNAVDYIQFQGNITGWPQGFMSPAGKDATVTIEAVDAMAWLASTIVQNDLVYGYANTTIGSLAFFLRGADPTQWSDATNNGYYARPQIGAGATSASVVPGSAATAVRFDGATKWAIDQQWTSSGAWSITFWLQGINPNAATSYVLGGGVGAAAADPVLIVNRSQAGRIICTSQTGGWTAQSLPGFLNDQFSHMVCITSDGTTAANTVIYIDGVARTESTGAGTPTAYLWYLGTATTNTTLYYNGILQDVAVFNKQLSSAEVSGFYGISGGFVSESVATRVTRILDDVGWPAAWRTITTTARATCGQLIYNANNANALLQQVMQTEQGRIFASKTNFVTFLERYYVQEQTVGNTAQQAFTDAGGVNDLGFSTFEFQYNDVDVTNQATVTTPTTWASSSDSTSITANGLQAKKVDTILTSFTDANSMAAGLVAAGKTATYRVAPIVAFPATNSTCWPTILGLELGQRASMKITPMAVGSQNSQEVTIEEMDWDISELWQLTIAGSPVKDVWFKVDDAASLVDGSRVIGY